VGAAKSKTVDAGLASSYAADGVYEGFRFHGFFLVRRGGKLMAISSICTHRVCKLTAEPDRSFYCDCHGSTFDPNGKVTQGPAKRDLPVYPVHTDERGHVIVVVG
jgi:Rieske Fe-S protein